MKLQKTLEKLLSPIELKLEDAIVDTWRWLIKSTAEEDQVVDVVAVGRAKDKTIYSKGFCPTTVGPQSKRPAVVLRSMVQSKLVAEKGPMPVLPTHRLVLLPLPSFYWRSSPFEVKSFFKDWEGRTEVEGAPFCFYTLGR